MGFCEALSSACVIGLLAYCEAEIKLFLADEIRFKTNEGL